MIDLSCYGNTLKTQKGECIKDAEREIDGCTLVPQWRCIFDVRKERVMVHQRGLAVARARGTTRAPLFFTVNFRKTIVVPPNPAHHHHRSVLAL